MLLRIKILFIVKTQNKHREMVGNRNTCEVIQGEHKTQIEICPPLQP